MAWLFNVRSDYSLNAPSFGVNLRLFKGRVRNNPSIADDFRYMFGGRGRQNDNDDSASGGCAFDELEGWRRWLSGLNVKMELYPANGQGYIYDNSYTKQ